MVIHYIKVFKTNLAKNNKKNVSVRCSIKRTLQAYFSESYQSSDQFHMYVNREKWRKTPYLNTCNVFELFKNSIPHYLKTVF